MYETLDLSQKTIESEVYKILVKYGLDGSNKKTDQLANKLARMFLKWIK